MDNIKHVVYTDGGCHPETGSWSFIEINPVLENILVPAKEAKQHIIKHGEGYVYDTTNNRMELWAIINAVKSFPRGSHIAIYSDSGYCVNGHNSPSQLSKWVDNNWKTSTKSPVSNQDLWMEILLLDTQYHVEYNLVKGHNKDKTSPHKTWNDICDDVCTEYRLYALNHDDDRTGEPDYNWEV
jgi:ribonuclease HI